MKLLQQYLALCKLKLIFTKLEMALHGKREEDLNDLLSELKTMREKYSTEPEVSMCKFEKLKIFMTRLLLAVPTARLSTFRQRMYHLYYLNCQSCLFNAAFSGRLNLCIEIRDMGLHASGVFVVNC